MLKCGYIFYKPRILKVFNDLNIEYFEPETKEIRGKINLKHVLKVDLVDDNKWTVEISGRVYKFKVL